MWLFLCEGYSQTVHFDWRLIPHTTDCRHTQSLRRHTAATGTPPTWRLLLTDWRNCHPTHRILGSVKIPVRVCHIRILRMTLGHREYLRHRSRRTSHKEPHRQVDSCSGLDKATSQSPKHVDDDDADDEFLQRRRYSPRTSAAGPQPASAFLTSLDIPSL